VYKNVVDTTGQRAPINLLSDHHPVPKNYASATPPSTAASSSYTALNCAGSRHASCTTHSCRGGVRVVVVAVGVVADTLVVSSLSHSRWCSRCHCRDHGHSRGSTANRKCRPFPPLRSRWPGLELAGMAEGATTAKPEAFQPRAEGEAEGRPEMPVARARQRACTVCLAATRGPRQRACAGIMAVTRGPAQMACTGMPGCRESARRKTRAGQSRRRERRVAVVAIAVAVVRVIASVSVRVPMRMPVVIASVRVHSMTMRRRRGRVPVRVRVRRRRSSSSCRYIVAVAVVVVVVAVVA
jgi:hypothetical protein